VLLWAGDFVLGVVVMMVMAMMMMRGRESGAGEHHQKQGSGENLFHAPNVAWTPEGEKSIQEPAPK
jgi:hypothetical protein